MIDPFRRLRSRAAPDTTDVDSGLRVLVLTTSFPLNADSSSGIFVARFLDHLPAEISAIVLTPATPSVVSPLRRGRHVVYPVAYAPRRYQNLAQEPGGIPAAVGRNPMLWVFVPCLFASLLIQTVRKARECDLIHANWSVCGVIAVLVGKTLGVPVVTTLRGEDVSRAIRGGFARAVLKVCAKWSERVVAVGIGVARNVLTIAPRVRGLCVIPNGTAPPAERTESEAKRTEVGLTLITVGSLIPRKGIGTTLRALSLLDGRVSARLIIVGDGADREALEALACSFGVRDRVCFAGLVAPEDVSGFLEQADVFVSTSLGEGRPNAVVEAMAMGLPVIASDIDGFRELVENGRTGFLVPLGEPEPLADRISQLASEPCLRDTLRRNTLAFARSKFLTWSETAGQYADLYEEVIRGCSYGDNSELPIAKVAE